MRVIDRATLVEWMAARRVCLVDVRGERRFRLGHLPGALHVAAGRRFESDARAVLGYETRTIATYCQGGGCSAAEDAAVALEAMGHADVFVYEGGIEDWEEAGLEFVTEPE